MSVKLHINVSQGIIDIEGDPDFVREIYTDFRDNLLTANMIRGDSRSESDEGEESEEAPKPRGKTKRKALARKRPSGDEVGSGVNVDVPKLDRDLDTSKLAAFYGQFNPRNHPEKILIFLSFLVEELDIESPNTDQVYTCYVKANERVPKAFAQAFRDTSGKTFGYIEYKSGTEMRITTSGINHFKFDIKKMGAE